MPSQKQFYRQPFPPLYTLQTKNSKHMRKTQTWQSIFTKRKNKKIGDLITSSQTNIASQYTQSTTTGFKTSQTNRQSNLHEYDYFDDVIEEENDNLFISEEEEEAIKAIFELARKGKITPGNAFDLPVKVVNTQGNEGGTMRFWKFASELLHTSMSIYDKRVENVFISTNSMSDHLNRAKNKDLDQISQTSHSKSKRKRKQFISYDIQELFQAECLSVHEIKNVQTDNPEKFNMKMNKSCFFGDHLFQNKLKLFDSNCLSGLFLNIFEMQNNLEISFLKKFSKANDNNPLMDEYHMSTDQDDEKYLLSDKQLKINAFLLKNQMFAGITRFINNAFDDNDMYKEEYEQIKSYYRYIEQNYQQIYSNNKSRDSISQLDISLKAITPDLQSFHNLSHEKSYFQSATQIRIDEDESCPFLSNRIPQNENDRNFIDERDRYHTVMTPWEMQSKGSKIAKLKKKSQRMGTTLNKKSKVVDNFSIDFTFDIEESKEKIIQSQLQKSKFTQYSDTRYRESFILPKIINPSIEIRNRKKQISRNQLSTTNPTNQILPSRMISHNQITESIDKNFLSELHGETTHLSHLDNEQNDEQIIHPETTFYDILPQNMSTQGLRNMKTFGLRNIRDIKQLIFNQVQKKKSIKISDINTPISPAGILIIFLHLVNQTNLDIKSIEDGTNIELLWNLS